MFSSFTLWILQGFPKAVTLEGISLVTTEPAPIVTLSPIVTPGHMQTLPPIHTLFPIFIFFPNSNPLFLNSTLIGWPAVYIPTLGPRKTLSPKVTSQTSKITKL